MSFSSEAGNGKWIWYPGDFAIWLHTKVSGLRQERGQPYPPFWRVDGAYGLVQFQKEYHIQTPETISLFVEGKYYLKIDKEILHDFDAGKIVLPTGKHTIQVRVENYGALPSILVQGNTVFSDESWQVTCQNKDQEKAETWHFSDPGKPPTSFALSYQPMQYKVVRKDARTLLIDFGKETCGKIILNDLKGSGSLGVYYGETQEEALAQKEAETYNIVKPPFRQKDTLDARAFRYVYIVADDNVKLPTVDALYEYLPLKKRGAFSCSDDLLNKIYDVSLYTLELNTRAFLIDGIKRDHWIWAGDAYQSYLMNFYSFFDEDVNKRTIYALRGHDPVETHINTILDYSFYWILGVFEHYWHTGDKSFVKQVYPRMHSLAQFCLSRRNAAGFIEGLKGDWVFIDWADMDKTGAVSFEQILFAKSMEAMAACAAIANDDSTSKEYKKIAVALKQKINTTFWNDQSQAFVHNLKDGRLSDVVTRYANMFAILFDYVPEVKKKMIKQNVILNNKVQSITTPYMKFYELAALCEIDEKQKAINYVRSYWGGMLDRGATTIWETFDPAQQGAEQYAMYNRPFGKSLCHAWGANPVYLFGKYLLGVKPLAAGYTGYEITPSLAGLKWIKGEVPTPKGNIQVFMDGKMIKVKTIEGKGILNVKSNKFPSVNVPGTEIKMIKNGLYAVSLLKPNVEYTVLY